MSDLRKTIHPAAFSLLKIEHERGNSTFVYHAYMAVSKYPQRLNEKFVAEINNWTEVRLSGMELEKPEEYRKGASIALEGVRVGRRRNRGKFRHPAIILETPNKWRIWALFTESFSFKVGDTVNVTGKIRDVGEGMLFLERGVKITKA